jgi:peptide-methionine (R)-S-oxide reductase
MNVSRLGYLFRFRTAAFVNCSRNLYKGDKKPEGVLNPGESPNQITEDEWKKRLTPQQYHVCRQSGTEKPFSGEYVDHYSAGTYICVCCGTELFSSDTKFKTGCGWPSFYAPLDKPDGEPVARQTDTSYDMERTEVLCSKCNAHLGHVFTDGPQPTGERFCINSVSLKFKSQQKNE